MSAPPFGYGTKVWPGLAKLNEEAGEVIQVIGKLMATGGERKHWGGSDLQARLEDEVADLQAALDFLLAHNGRRLSRKRVAARVKMKRRTYERWHRQGRK